MNYGVFRIKNGKNTLLKTEKKSVSDSKFIPLKGAVIIIIFVRIVYQIFNQPMHSFHTSSKSAIIHPLPIPARKGLLEAVDCLSTQHDSIIFKNLIFDQKNAEGLHLKELLRNDPTIDTFFSRCPSITFLLDVRDGTYIYLSSNTETMLGYAATDLQQSELTLNAALIHPEDSILLRSLTEQSFKRLKKLLLHDLNDYTLNREYRLIRRDGSTVGILEQSKVVETGNKGEVISLFGQLTDVSMLKKKQGPAVYLTSASNQEIIDFTPKKSPSLLSNRELQVMELLSRGLNSKQIAHILSISYYTVGKHRQKMLAKTQSKNSSELIHFAEYNQLV
jgi:DNA-binding CsgD family transcriptional regulator/PAS domain-containing protein